MSDDPLKDCPQCNKPELKKLISAAAFRLKGGGWYETDFKGGNKKNVAQGDSKDKSGSAKKSSDKTSKSDSSSSSSTKSAGANK